MKSYHLRQSELAIILVSLIYFATVTRVANAARPGFIYTRNRGRCTPRFWSSQREAWPRMVPQAASVSKIFGSRAFERYSYDLTLVEATKDEESNNVFGQLVKEATAALLNSYSRRNRFPYSPWEVKTMLIQGLVSERAALVQAHRFSQANEACD